MPNLNDLKSSKYLTKEDVGDGVLVTIDRYEEQNVAMDNKPKEVKWVAWFRELDKPLVMNITNGQLLCAIIGSENLDDAIGQQVVLFNDKTVMYAGEMVGGIRIRAKRTPQFRPPVDNNPPIDNELDDPPF